MQLPDRPSMEYLRKQAKRRRQRDRVGLARAQRDLARDYGFASWPRLVRHVHAVGLTGLDRALALAETDRLRLLLADDPGLALRPLTSGEVPLIRLLRDSDGTPKDVAGCAGVLLDAGASPSSSVLSEDGQWALTACYYAVERGNLALLRLLVDGGARPADEDDAFYHACEQSDPAFLDLLYASGFESMFNHKLDFEDAVGVQWFLDRGVDVDEHGSLHWAIGRGRGTEILRQLIDAGADIDLPHPDVGFRPLEAAARCGHLAAYELLEELGASADLTPTSRAVLAVARGETDQLPPDPPPLPGFPSTDHRWLLGQLAQLGRTDVVRRLLDAGVPVDSRGWSNFTPLDQAAMHGRAETCRLLVDRGADLHDCAFDDEHPTPLDCAIWGWRHNRAPDGDYEEVVALLVAARAPTRHAPPTGNDRIDTLLSGTAETMRGSSPPTET